MTGRTAATRTVEPVETGPDTKVAASVAVRRGGTLQLRGLSKSFGAVPVIRNVDLRLDAGRLTAIIGPNGAGKTTLLNLITGHAAAQSGDVLLDGRSLLRLPAHRRAALGVRRTFQIPRLIPEWNLLDNASIGLAWPPHLHWSCWWRPLAWARRRSLAAQALASLGLDPAANLAELPQYGGSVLRLVDIARVIAAVRDGGASVLLLDEPAAGLSSGERQRLQAVLTELKSCGLTIVLIEHNLSFVQSLADCVVVLDRGQPIAQGSFDDVMRDRAVRLAYLGSDGHG